MTQAQRSNSILDEFGRAVAGVSIYVYNFDGSLASLTSDGSLAANNPLTSDEFGSYSYYALVGYYREDIWFGGKKRWSENNVAVGSPGADLALRTDLAASTGPALLGFSSSGIYGAGTLGQALTRQGTAVADSNLVQGALVNLYVNSGVTHMQLADASASKPAHGFCPVAVANAAVGAWSRRGIIPGTSGTAFAADLWLSDVTPGGSVSAAPTTAGHLLQHVGMVLPGLGIEFDPKPEIQL